MQQQTIDQAEAAAIITDLYRSLLGREPDPTGLGHYTQVLATGTPVNDIRRIFLEGDEYAARRRRLFPDAVLVAEGGEKFPLDYQPPGEAGRCYRERIRSGFFDRYCSGTVILDVGFTGYDNPERKAALPHAIGIDLDFPGYDGIHLPYPDQSVDTVFSSHCLEHIVFDHAVIQDWYRVLKIGGFIVCMVPSQALYEKKRFLPSNWNGDHKRMYTPSSLALAFETALPVNSYRIRHLAENDRGFDYSIGPDRHSDGAYEIEIVLERIVAPAWTLA
jgi:SAM-dependent methyltransferase